MRQTLMLATMAVLTACGVSGSTPWDQNHDGLITACEGLNAQACDATGGCERVAFACTLECRDDGHGGCVPCNGDFCRPAPITPPTTDCSQVPLSLCGFLPQCERAQMQVCSASTGGGSTGQAAPRAEDPAVPPQPRCGNETCTTIEACVNRQPATCESLSIDVCLAHPGCALETSGGACEIACDPTTGTCPACASLVAQERCVTAPPPGTCELRDPNTCSMDGRCMLEAGSMCDGRCDTSGGGACAPCAPTAPRCVPVPPVDECAGRDPNTCSMDGRCMLEPGPVCVCTADGLCPPCAADPAALRCVPVPPADECAARDAATCAVDGRCALEAWACPAICQDDGRGGCLPCQVPAPSCVPVAPRCDGLDRVSCDATPGCEVMQLGVACTTECRDDGQGGCLPCNDFVCVDSGSSGGGSTPPPQPAPPRP